MCDHLLPVKCGNDFSVGVKNNGGRRRGQRAKKDRVGNKDLREEERVLVTHCGGNSSGQRVVGYMRQPPEDWRWTSTGISNRLNIGTGLESPLFVSLLIFRLCIMS